MLLLLAFAGQPVDLSASVSREVARQECDRAAAAGDRIFVCGRRRSADRYRLSEQDLRALDPNRTPPSVAREGAKWIEEGDSGIGSCTNVGPGGWTGCMQKGWKKQRQQQKGWYGN